MSTKTTLKEIARLAGVSRPAVSMVMKDPATRHVAEDKKNEILRLARELDYRPDYAAMKLRGMPTRTIGLIGSLFTVPIHAALADAIMKRFQERDYQVSLGDPRGSIGKERRLVADFEARGVDGLILMNAIDPALPDTTRIPFVAVTHNQKYFDLAVDLKRGGLMAGRHLLEHGHEKLGFVTSYPRSGASRREGLAMAMAESGREFKPEWTLCRETCRADFETRLAELVGKTGVTGFFCLNDFIAAATVQALVRQGLAVPRDAAVIGFDGLAFGALTAPSLATVAQPVARLAEAAAQLLTDRMRGAPGKRENPEWLAPTLRVGESCGCVSAARETWDPNEQLILPGPSALQA